MSSHDWLEDRPPLPDEAGDQSDYPFNPVDEWIAAAPRELQIEAMRQWFLSRYEDPANSTPYNGKEGGYLFVHGGPYDPNDEIQERFHEVVEYDVMEELVENLYQEVGDEWAPIEREVDYDDALSLEIGYPDEPFRMLEVRLEQIAAVMTVHGSLQAQQLVLQLAYGATITALESYLWDTVSYWTSHNEEVRKEFVCTNKDFGKTKIELADIYTELKNIENRLGSYLQGLVWHRLFEVKPIMQAGFKITLPDIGPLMKCVLIRHDIIHRSGRNKDGEAITVSEAEVNKLVAMVRDFALAIEIELEKRFPAF